MKTIFTTTRYGLKRIQIITQENLSDNSDLAKNHHVPLLTSTDLFSFIGGIGLVYSCCVTIISLFVMNPQEFIYGLSFTTQLFSVSKHMCKISMVLFIYSISLGYCIHLCHDSIRKITNTLINKKWIYYTILTISIIILFYAGLYYKLNDIFTHIYNYYIEVVSFIIFMVFFILLFLMKGNILFNSLSIYTVLSIYCSLYVINYSNTIVPCINLTIFLTDGEQIKAKDVFMSKESLVIAHLDKGEIIIPLSRIKKIEKIPSFKKPL